MRIDALGARLDARIYEFDSRLSGRIGELNSRLSGRIDGLGRIDRIGSGSMGFQIEWTTTSSATAADA